MNFNDLIESGEVKWIGDGRVPWRLGVRVKRRFAPHAPKGGGTVKIEGNSVFMRWKSLGWNAAPSGHYAVVVVIWKRDGQWVAESRVAVMGRTGVTFPLSRVEAGEVGLFLAPHPNAQPRPQDVRTDAVGLTVQQESDMIGKDWPTGSPAPVFLMAPTGTQSAQTWRTFLDDVLPQWIDLGIDGTWCPWLGIWRDEYKELDIIARNNGLVVGGWLVSEGDMGGNELWGRAAAEAMLTRLISRYDAIINAGFVPPPFVLGPSWDIWQATGWDGVSDVNDFISWGKQQVGARWIFLGARARANPATGLPEQLYIGDYYADEAHIVRPVVDADPVMLQTIRNAGNRPAASFDRFRVRSGGEDKDMTEADMPIVIESARRHNVAIIIGYPPVGGGNVSDKGSGPCTNLGAVRAALAGKVPPPPPDPGPGPDPGPTPPGEIPTPPAGLIAPSHYLPWDLQHMRLGARPKGAEGTWHKFLHWPKEVGDMEVWHPIPGDDWWWLWMLNYFVGIRGTFADECSGEAKLRMPGARAGILLPKYVAEKDSPGMAFDATHTIALPKPILLPPGTILGIHTGHSQRPGPDDNPDDFGRPHVDCTFHLAKAT